MPFYEYECRACGRRLEALRKISDAPLLDCPECGKPAMKKLISRAAFRLKGTGWYETDFKNSGAPADKEAKTTTASSGDSNNGDSNNGDSNRGDSNRGDSNRGDSNKTDSKTSSAKEAPAKSQSSGDQKGASKKSSSSTEGVKKSA